MDVDKFLDESLARAKDEPLYVPPQKHNWLYSVVPLLPDNSSSYGGVYLVAYCKNDRKYATVKLQLDQMVDFVVVRDAAIPVDGCEPIQPTSR